MRLEEKKAIVAAMHEKVSEALSAVLADYRGLSVEEMTELRKLAREQKVYLKIVRNTLARRAVVSTEFSILSDDFVGPTIVALSMEDPGSAARLFKDFAKQHEALKVKVLAVGGQKYGPQDIDVLAQLPTRDQALATLMQLMLAPTAQLARALNDIPGRVVRVLAAVSDKKETSG